MNYQWYKHFFTYLVLIITICLFIVFFTYFFYMTLSLPQREYIIFPNFANLFPTVGWLIMPMHAYCQSFWSNKKIRKFMHSMLIIKLTNWCDKNQIILFIWAFSISIILVIENIIYIYHMLVYSKAYQSSLILFNTFLA